VRTAEIPVEAELVEKLADSFDSGPIIDDSGRRFLEEQTVGSIKGLKVLIFADEHPPPHFCVEFQGQSASFAIEDCQRLPGNKGLERFERNIKKWWQENRTRLIQRWNGLRPSDCPVGPVRA
jgi:hypothetical protein